jgi:hypothetical protein
MRSQSGTPPLREAKKQRANRAEAVFLSPDLATGDRCGGSPSDSLVIELIEQAAKGAQLGAEALVRRTFQGAR